MKTKLFIFCALCAALLICNACEDPVSQNYYEDTTKLWPAGDSIGEKYGYINEKGEMVIQPQFASANFFCNGVAKVRTLDYHIQFINKKGEVVFTLPEQHDCDTYFYNGYLRFYEYYMASLGIPDKYGLYDSNFNVVLPNIFLKIGYMSKEGLVAAGAGYYNKKGELALTLDTDTFDLSSMTGTVYEYGDFCDGVAVVKVLRYNKGHISSTVGAINTRGEWVIDTTSYSDLRSIGGGLLAYTNNHVLYGLIDTYGNKVTEPVFSMVGHFEDNDLLPVNMSDLLGKAGYVDKTGTFRIAQQFYYCEPFFEGVAWVNNLDGIYSLIDTKGNVLFTLEQGEMPSGGCHNGLMCIRNYTNKVVKYIDKNNKVIYSWKMKGSAASCPGVPPARFPKNVQP